MMIIDEGGSYTLEYVLIFAIGILITLTLFHSMLDICEINTCMASARNGASEGALMDSLAVYPVEPYEKYLKQYPRLKSTSKIVILKIKYKKMELSPVYNKTKIQLEITASAPSINNSYERNCLGDRINYYARRGICQAFKTENISNSKYNPAFSDNYFFTTLDVRWL